MLRRRTPPAEPPPEPEAEDRPGAKGRPTPKRREAEAQRRKTAKVPTDRREATRLRRQRMREERVKMREAMRTGDERYLPARDAGPLRRAVRDLVDEKRTALEFLMPVVLVLFVLTLIPLTITVLASNLLMLVLLSVLVADGLRLRRRVRAMVAERFPDEEPRGLTSYALMRALQIRRLRLPPPKVGPGAKR